MMILGIPIHDIDEVNLLLRLREWLLGKEQKLVVTPNPEFMLLAQKDAHFRDILKQADLSLPDGVGLRFAAAALTDTYLHFRHTGVDTLERLAKLCEETGKIIHFDVDSLDFLKNKIPGTISSFQIEVRGVCSKCSVFNRKN